MAVVSICVSVLTAAVFLFLHKCDFGLKLSSFMWDDCLDYNRIMV